LGTIIALLGFQLVEKHCFCVGLFGIVLLSCLGKQSASNDSVVWFLSRRQAQESLA
jgi:hypothetical protein